ncbi:MAG: pentapeptide repeat-containing protein [Chloroflexota bacterium]|nr:pentapeptide repeat-containing protein [Chloroflexota bacterium]
MSQEIKIEKKASEVIQPTSPEAAREAIRAKKDLSGADLQNMDLQNLNATGSVLRKTNLTGADISHGLLVNPNFYKATAHNVALHHTIFLGGDLVKTDFKDADLSNSGLIGVDAREAKFPGANLRNAAIVSADLEGADFTGANLTNARLASLNVKGADFTGASVAGMRAFNVDWSEAKVPPAELPAPLVELPTWAWSVLIGSFVGLTSLFVYGLIHRQRQSDV